MRALVVLALLAGCYAPALAPCSVRCDSAAPCPDDQTCGDDLYCHAPGDEDDCSTGNLFTLAVTKGGTGTGRITSDGLDCGTDCITAVTGGSRVELAVSPDTGSRFVGFSGECAGQNPCSVIVSTDKTIAATFNRSATLDLTFLGSGLGGVESDPAGIDCITPDETCSADFDLGAEVTLLATPDIDFLGWGGDCSEAGTSLECTLVLDQPRSVGVEFQ